MDLFLESYCDIQDNIFSAYINSHITESEKDILLSELDLKYSLYSESLKDVGKRIKTVVKNPRSEESKKILNGLADKYNKGMNNRATSVAKKIVKDPTKGGKVQVSPEVYDKYKKDMLKWRSRYKVGEILATGAIAIGPIDTVIKIATVTAMSRSNDPVDKKTMELLNKVKEKALSLKNKVAGLAKRVKGKQISEQELTSQINAADTAAAALAKETDVAKTKKENLKPATVSESVYEKMDTYFTENSVDKYQVLNMMIEKTNFSEVDMFSVICHYTEI